MTDKDKMPPKATQHPADKQPMRGGYGDHASHDDRDAKPAYPDAGGGMPARNADAPKAGPAYGSLRSPGTDLVGMAFATFDKDGKISHTGTVEGWVMPDRYVVSYADGKRKMVGGSQLASSDINETRPNTIELFEDEGALKKWMESDEAKAITKPAPQ